MAYNKTVMFFFQKPENYYRQDFVRKIRAEKNGYEYLTLYEELLIESLNKDGVLANFFDDKIVEGKESIYPTNYTLISEKTLVKRQGKRI